MRERAVATLTVLLAALLGFAGSASAAAPARCADDSSRPGGAHPGGDWRSYGHDLSNTRSQGKESKIGPTNVAQLAPAWTFSTVAAGGGGDFTGTPVVADGCVYAGSNRGWVFAINADTGKIVWRARVPKVGGAYGAINSTVSVPGDGRVYAGVSDPTQNPCEGDPCNGPYAVAFDQATGKTVWRSRPLDNQVGSDLYSSPAVYDPTPSGPDYRVEVDRAALGRARSAYRRCLRRARTRGRRHKSPHRQPAFAGGVPRRCHRRYQQAREHATHRVRIDDEVVILGISDSAAEVGPSEHNRYAFQGNSVILAARTGALLKRVWTIHAPAKACPSSICPPHSGQDEFAGGPVWSSDAIDPAHGVAYVGTGNPANPKFEAKTANAVVKFGVDRNDKEHFGKILGHYKGTNDQSDTGITSLPCVDAPGNQPIIVTLGGCVDIDADFGASPNIFADSRGRKLVGDGQKSGIYHAFDAATMDPVWSSRVGTLGSGGGIVGSTAYDGKRIYGPNTVPALVWSTGRDNGTIDWDVPATGGANYGNPISVANGVVYTTNFSGTMSAIDAQTGVLLHEFSMYDRTQASGPTNTWGGGVAVARNTVYAATGTSSFADGYIIAFRLGATGSPPPDTMPPPPGNGAEGGGQGPTLIAGPEAAIFGYATPRLLIPQGTGLSFLNMDIVGHNVTAKQIGTDGAPVFRSSLAGTGEQASVKGVEKLKPGAYDFFCTIHPSMTGQVTVVGGGG